MSSTQRLSRQQMRAIATRRLKRDLIELRQQSDDLLCIAAQPRDDNLFEWHANIKPHDGVYSGVFFHLILTFPDSYPSNPPEVKICTPLSHPNVFNSWICLSMLRPHTGTVPYEGWSAAYSVTSVLMQLQSFLFADKIDQDEGYQRDAHRSQSDIARSIQLCKSFVCSCGHSHHAPCPPVKGIAESLIKVYPTDPDTQYLDGVDIDGTHCQSTRKQEWISAYGQYGVNHLVPKIMFEVFIDWTPDAVADLIIGFGTEHSIHCGFDKASCGYQSGRTSGFVHENRIRACATRFGKGDTISVAIDFEKRVAYFALNGRCFWQNPIPTALLMNDPLLFPIVTFKECRVELNFGKARKPCAGLLQRGFKTWEEVAKSYGILNKAEAKEDGDGNQVVDWQHSEFIIDELWVEIFEFLTTPQIFSASTVCRKWLRLIDEHNIMERSEIYCFFSKGGLTKRNILGIGLSIKESEVGFQVMLSSQMDILSLEAWKNGCRIGVWGEQLTHFLPLAMNRRHAEEAHEEIMKHLRAVCATYSSIEMKSYHGKERAENPNGLERAIKKSECLQMVDTLVTMMNKFVVEFVTGHKDTDPNAVNMVMCEKMVLGYCALHHLLLYLKHCNAKEVTHFANRTIETFKSLRNGANKWNTRDLGKVLIYLMISSKYEWSDIAQRYIEESFTRRTKWFVDARKHPQYVEYDTTAFVPGRVKASFTASSTGRKLVMFQVWFMRNSQNETLKGYNQRLGRPTSRMRNGVVAKAKYIMASASYADYFKDLDFKLVKSNGFRSGMDQMLRFAVWNSYCLGYHWKKGLRNWEYERLYQAIAPPEIIVGGKLKRKKPVTKVKLASKKPKMTAWKGTKAPQNGNGIMGRAVQPPKNPRPVRPAVQVTKPVNVSGRAQAQQVRQAKPQAKPAPVVKPQTRQVRPQRGTLTRAPILPKPQTNSVRQAKPQAVAMPQTMRPAPSVQAPSRRPPVPSNRQAPATQQARGANMRRGPVPNGVSAPQVSRRNMPRSSGPRRPPIPNRCFTAADVVKEPEAPEAQKAKKQRKRKKRNAKKTETKTPAAAAANKKAQLVDATSSISAESPLQTPIPSPISNEPSAALAEEEQQWQVKKTKAQKARLRKKAEKRKNRKKKNAA